MPDLATLQITTSYSPFAFIYGLFKPNIVLNGRLEKRPWGTQSFELPVGSYRVEISYPWLFNSECGKNSVEVTLQPGGTARVKYRAGMIRYLPGKISIEDPIPTARALPSGR